MGGRLQSKMETKTNPMRHLEKLKIPYEAITYDPSIVNGMEVASINGQNPDCVFKTLMTVGKEKCYYCFMVPVSGELDLKKAAASVGEKSISMLKSDQLLPLMGYVHGGCSPLCTKRPVRITIDSTAEGFEKIYFSAGKVGCQLKVSVTDLPKMMDFQFADIRMPRQEGQHRFRGTIIYLMKSMLITWQKSILIAHAPRSNALGMETATSAWHTTEMCRRRRSLTASDSS